MRFLSAIPAAALAVVFSFAVQAQDVSSNGASIHALPNASKATPKPFTGACAAFTKAKFASLMHRGGGLDCGFSSQIGPSRNLADFTHPSTGTYCFLPTKAAGLSKNNKLDAVLPSVDVEWYHSSGYMLLAYQLQPGADTVHDCPVGYLEVLTYDFSSGSAVLSDSVAFNIKVM